MEDHLSDLAALEWARFEETRLAPEAGEEVRPHLDSCDACRKKVEDFRKLEWSMHPYGTAFSEPRGPLYFRRALLVLLLVVILGLSMWIAS